MQANHPLWCEAMVVGQTPTGRVTRMVYNRTGSALVAGGIYQFDTGLSAAAESSANSDGVKLPAVTDFAWRGGKPLGSSAWHNIVAVGTLGGSSPQNYSVNGGGWYCVALSAAGDNEMSEVLIYGDVTLAKAGVQLSFIGVSNQENRAGSKFIPTSAQTYATLPTYSSSVGIYIGYLYAARTETATPAATAVDAFFSGFGLLR